MQALALADEVYIGAVARAASLKQEERFDTGALVDYLKTQGVACHAEPTNQELLRVMQTQTQATGEGSRLVVFFTNGSFDGIIGDFVGSVK